MIRFINIDKEKQKIRNKRGHNHEDNKCGFFISSINVEIRKESD